MSNFPAVIITTTTFPSTNNIMTLIINGCDMHDIPWLSSFRLWCDQWLASDIVFRVWACYKMSPILSENCFHQQEHQPDLTLLAAVRNKAFLFLEEFYIKGDESVSQMRSGVRDSIAPVDKFAGFFISLVIHTLGYSQLCLMNCYLRSHANRVF